MTIKYLINIAIALDKRPSLYTKSKKGDYFPFPPVFIYSRTKHKLVVNRQFVVFYEQQNVFRSPLSLLTLSRFNLLGIEMFTTNAVVVFSASAGVQSGMESIQTNVESVFFLLVFKIKFTNREMKEM